MLLFEFDQQMKLQAVNVYNKQVSGVTLPDGAGYLPYPLLGYLVSGIGGFDYVFTQLDNEKTSFHIGYTDYEKGKDFKGMAFTAISRHVGDAKLTTDKLNLVSSASSMRVYPAKLGFVMISEYFKKTRKMEVRIEKMN